jgi:hypothetical protein
MVIGFAQDGVKIKYKRTSIPSPHAPKQYTHNLQASMDPTIVIGHYL